MLSGQGRAPRAGQSELVGHRVFFHLLGRPRQLERGAVGVLARLKMVEPFALVERVAIAQHEHR
jgi:hypothetical protein